MKKTVKNKRINDKIHKTSNKQEKMHLATEVTSTTNHQIPSMDTKHSNNNNSNSNNNNNDQSKNDATKSANGSFLTAQEFAERTIDSLLAEHPGELVRTGSPHIVNRISYFLVFLREFFREI